MKVYTYFNSVPGLVDDALLDLWRSTWAKNGWEPVVLTEEDAYRADPQVPGERDAPCQRHEARGITDDPREL